MLVLFDIDGTLLLGAAEAHRRALHAAMQTVFGVRAPHAIGPMETAGRTDIEIAREVLLRSGVGADDIDARLPDLRSAWVSEHAAQIAPDLRETVAPGMAELLADLRWRGDAVRLSLVTGNLEPIARLKLARAGIGGFFPAGQGGFGSDSESRVELPPIARARAGVDGRPWPRARTILVGDTPLDIACAHADGVRCIAVASGPFGAGDLTAADAVARDGHEVVAKLAPLLAPAN